MRSSKSRSRNKANRPRTLGNIINRVFDSSGPEGKVRGTPQQIIEKYQLLARDAQLSNDRVAAENFLQHAEHYTRMLGEAQREMAAEQEERQRQQQQNGGGGQSNYGGQNPQNGGNRDRDRDNWRDRQDRDYREYRDDRPDESAGAAVIELGEGETNLVETPEARPFQQRRDRDDRDQRGERRDNDRRDDRGDRRDGQGLQGGQDRRDDRGERREGQGQPQGGQDRRDDRGERREGQGQPQGGQERREDRGEPPRLPLFPAPGSTGGQQHHRTVAR